MKVFLEDFYERQKEVRYYISAIKFIEACFEKNKRGTLSTRQNLTLKTFRAGAILVLYNAIEASMRDAIGAIYEEIGKNQLIPFQDLRQELRKKIIRDLKKNLNENQHDNMSNVAVEIILASFDERKLFSGNVDAKEVRHVASQLGFSFDTDWAKTEHGRDLLTIKSERNNLAHGVKAFSEVGRYYPTSDLIRLSRTSLAYLESILRNIENYIDNKEYLHINVNHVIHSR